MNAGRAFYYTLKQGDLSPDLNSNWDDYGARLARYALYSAYYNNNVYDDLSGRVLRLASANRGLYKYTTGLRNPVQRLVDLITAKCYPGSIDYQNLTGGAIPIMQAEDDLREAIKQIFLWSNFGVAKSLFVRNNALFGDTALKIVDEPEKRKVRMEVLHPGYIKDVLFDSVGNVKYIMIEYQKSEETFAGSGSYRNYTYRETWYEDDGKDWVATFKDGQPFPFLTTDNGELVDKAPNTYGFVPVVIGHFKQLGPLWGVNSFNSAIPKIDALNDSASVLNDYLRRAMNPSWLANFGKAKTAPDQAKSDLDLSTTRRDQERITYVDAPDAKLQSLVHDVDIAGALSNMDSAYGDLKQDMVVLGLADITLTGDESATAALVRASVAVAILTEANGMADDCLVRGTQMAITAAAERGYEGFRGFNADSFSDGDLAFFIKPRDIIEDRLSKLQTIQLYQASGAPPEKSWEILGSPQDEIDRWNAQQQQDKLIAAFAATRNQQQPPNAPPQLGDGKPTIKGEPLPDDQATAPQDITPEQVKAWSAQFELLRRMSGK